jgi:prefoldin subunit 5
MKKALIIIASLCALIAIGTVLFTNTTTTKVENIPKQAQATVKAVKQVNSTTTKAIETLNAQKVSLQKALVNTKADLQNTKAKQHELVTQVKQLQQEVQQQPIVNNDELVSTCVALSETIDSLLINNQVQDSLYTYQTNTFDSLICVQQNQIAILSASNQSYLQTIDTLLQLNTTLVNANKKQERKIVLNKAGNKLLASGLLITTSVAAYLHWNNKI